MKEMPTWLGVTFVFGTVLFGIGLFMSVMTEDWNTAAVCVVAVTFCGYWWWRGERSRNHKKK